MGFYQRKIPSLFYANLDKNYFTKMKKLDCVIDFGKKYGRWR
ncbi:hypothetical protein SAMD00020551_1232 [Mesobacillus selenatarsenatis SF-1]|uniref:Uncharacterized protein n=1 Tax=Mesobacillus selenatarsenatis (strain DSM 18680 / JCM 14380 / FERM P-15431 / SF-1) TaxID=1321606 RepID=A0A0A8WZD9_MESS1|nr:hypothetical protein SAMD00020551_1232 [Mesobacillus selenatarsenatis SF-1]